MNYGVELAAALMGASESVDVLAAVGFEHVADMQELAAMVDKRIPMRWLFRDPSPEASPKSAASLRSLKDAGWEVRTLRHTPTINCVIVDSREGVMSPVQYGAGEPPTFLITSSLLQEVAGHFERAWAIGAAADDVTLFHESVLRPGLAEFASRLAVEARDTWSQVIADLAANPDLLYVLHPRRFEELIAELLARRGFDIKLTPATRDGGRDILAASKSEIGDQLYLVECKRFAKHRPVDVSIVRELYGVVSADNASAGLIVTTSYFTKDALSFREGIKYRLSLREYADLAQWLRNDGSQGA